MRGVFFQKPLEFTLNVDGEVWRQGDSISGTLSVKNHHSAEVALPELKVILSHGELNKVRKKDPEAFENLEILTLSESKTLAPLHQESFPWTFKTHKNSPISHKTGSLFLLYGQSTAPDAMGQLQINLRQFTLIEELLNLLQVEFHFVFKDQKTKKDFIESKFSPPAFRAFSTIEQLLLRTSFRDDELRVEYLFAVKKIDASAGMELVKSKKEFEQVFGAKEHTLPNGRINHDRMVAAVKEVIDELGLGALA